MSSRLVFVMCLLAIGCGGSQPGPPATNREHETLLDARRGFTTRIVTSGEPAGAPEQPDGREFDLVHYPSAVGRLALI